MKGYTAISLVILVSCMFFWAGSCSEEEDDDLAPMEKTEQEALYSAIQGFVGKQWNGSDLYPDPCGWTPIQVHLFTLTTLYCLVYHQMPK